MAAPALLRVLPANAQSAAVKIGFVSPKTGPIAAFSASDDFTLAQVMKAIGPGISNNRKIYPIQVISKDSQSSSNRAAEVTSELIWEKGRSPDRGQHSRHDKPRRGSGGGQRSAVYHDADALAALFLRPQGDPKKGFDWTYHFLWGLEDVIAAYTALWDAIPTNKIVGGLFPNDADGNAWGDPDLGFPKPLDLGQQERQIHGG